jgi:hypothetical protein
MWMSDWKRSQRAERVARARAKQEARRYAEEVAETERDSAQALVDMIDAVQCPDTLIVARVSWLGVGPEAPRVHAYKIHVQLTKGGGDRSWAYCEGTPFYLPPVPDTPGADWRGTVGAARGLIKAHRHLCFLGLAGFDVVIYPGPNCLRVFEENRAWRAETCRKAGRPDLAERILAVQPVIFGGAR